MQCFLPITIALCNKEVRDQAEESGEAALWMVHVCADRGGLTEWTLSLGKGRWLLWVDLHGIASRQDVSDS